MHACECNCTVWLRRKIRFDSKGSFFSGRWHSTVVPKNCPFRQIMHASKIEMDKSIFFFLVRASIPSYSFVKRVTSSQSTDDLRAASKWDQSHATKCLRTNHDVTVIIYENTLQLHTGNIGKYNATLKWMWISQLGVDVIFLRFYNWVSNVNSVCMSTSCFPCPVFLMFFHNRG